LLPSNAAITYKCWACRWDGRPFGHNRHGPKIGVCAPFGRESWVPV